jgi:rubrerythrin
MAFQCNAELIFELGIQIERNGKLFYQEIAKGAPDEQLTSLFLELAEWEEQHIDLFQRLLDELPDSMRQDDLFDPADDMMLYVNAAADSHVFVSTPDIAALVDEHCSSPLQALDMALAFEKDSVVYYTTMKRVVAKHLGQEKIDLLIEEELKHIAILNDRKKQLGP